MRDRVAAETTEEREARLQRMRDHVAAETTEKREARLQLMSTRQHERLARERVQERASSSSLLKQDSVSSLHAPTCTTCSESFPGLQLRSPSTECVCYYRDKLELRLAPHHALHDTSYIIVVMGMRAYRATQPCHGNTKSSSFATATVTLSRIQQHYTGRLSCPSELSRNFTFLSSGIDHVCIRDVAFTEPVSERELWFIFLFFFVATVVKHLVMSWPLWLKFM